MEKETKIRVKLSQVAEFLGTEYHGADVELCGISTPEDQRAGTICMIGKQGIEKATEGAASAYIIQEDVKTETDKPRIIVKDLRPTLVKILCALYPVKPVKRDIAKYAVIDRKANVAKNVAIGNFTCIGAHTEIGGNTRIGNNCNIGANVKMGENCILYSNVTIYDNCEIGNNVILHSGVVIGADGFGFIPAENPVKIPQVGKVVISDFVEMGANSCVDRATIGSTVIGFGTKIDNLVTVGHNTRIGKACLIAAQVGFSGSIETGDFVVAAGQAGFADHIKIGSHTVFGGQAGISGNVLEKGMYLGAPCFPVKDFARSYAVFKDLPQLRRRINELEKQNNRD